MTLEPLEKLKAVVTQFCQHFKLVKVETSIKGRPRKISEIDSLTLALYQHASTRATKKSVFDDFKERLKCSYKTFVVSVNASAVLCLRLLFIITRLGRKNQHLVKYTDATDIPVCLKKNADNHKTMKDLSKFGHSAKGWFFGLKLTITRDADGRLLAIMFTKAGDNDREIFRKINQDIFGILIADAGYVSKQLEEDMNIENKRWLFLKPFKTMKKLMTKWQEDLYKGRFQIEFDFRSLKLFHGLVTSMPRSVSGYLANYLQAIVSFIFSRV